MVTRFRLNTSSAGKLDEFKRLFAKCGCELEASTVDLAEVDADPLTVVVHKASQLDEGILVEDTSLAVEGASIGINIKWLLDHLESYLEHQAVWTVLLAQRLDGLVHVFKGEVRGTIVRASGSGGFGFDPYFLPEGSLKTLAEEKPDQVNARALAVQAFIEKRPFAIRAALKDWSGPWQEKS